MSDYVLPVGWKYNGSKENQTTFIGPGHTVSAPHFAIFDRVVPQYNNGRLTNPSYRIRVIRGFVDGDGTPIQGRAVIEATCRWPAAVDNNVVEAMVGQMGVFLSDTAMQNDIVVEQLLPRDVHSD